MAMQSLGMIILILAVLLVVGVPISYSIGIASLFTILQTVPLDISVVTGAQRIFVGMSKFSLTAIPFFILAGNLMNQGGIAKRLVNFVMAILGKLPGALLVTNVGANALFGAISGSASAAAAAVGSMVREGEEEQGYDEALCAATNGASAPSGLLIPPSNALITYSLAAGGTSVAALFMAGYLPGIIWALCCMVVAIIIARKKGYKGTPGKFSWSNLGKATLQAIPSLSLIIVVIGGIIAGVFSATEGSAIAVVYALILGICYRNITWKSFWNIVVDSAKMSGMVVFLIGVSNILGWVMAFLQIPQAVSAALLGITDNPIIILLIMNVILLIAGTFMDVTPAILIFTPLFLPIVQTFGMDPIHFGLVLVYNLCIGNITPPVGNTLFTQRKTAQPRGCAAFFALFVVQDHFAVRFELRCGEIRLFQRDPAGAESFEVGAGAAGQPLQPHFQRRGDKDVQAVAVPQVGVAAVGTLGQHHRPQGRSHRRLQRAGVAVVGAVEGVPAGQQRGQHLGVKALPVEVAARLGQPRGGALLRPEKEVVGVDQGAVKAGGQQGGEGALAAAAPPVDGDEGAALAAAQRLDPADELLKARRRGDGCIQIVVFHGKIPLCVAMRAPFCLLL